MKRYVDQPVAMGKRGRSEPRHEHDIQVEQSLRTIYEEQAGVLPDLTKLDRVRSNRWIVAVAAVSIFFLLLSSAAWAGFAFFKSFSGFAGKGLIVSIEGPEQVSLGQEVTYFVNYQNTLNDPLAAVQVRVNFPTDFVRTDVTPLPTEKALLWNLGALAAEERGTLTIRGKFTGALGTVTAVQTMATYHPANYSSEFEALAVKQITYAHTVIEGWIQVPEKAVPGDHVALIYHIKNTGSDPLLKMEARIVLPDGFTPDKPADGKVSFEGKMYKQPLDVISQGSTTDIGITGVFSAGSGGEAKVTAQVGNIGLDGVFLPAQLASAAFPVMAGDLSLKLVVNGSDQPERSIGYGDALQMAIGYENMADEPLKNVVLRLSLEPVALVDTGKALTDIQVVDLKRMQSEASSTSQGNQIVWTSNEIKELKEMRPHESGSIELMVPTLPATTGTPPLAVRATLIADIETVGNTKMKRTIQLSPFIFKLKSDAAISAEARYFSEEGAPLGSGPLPPRVGQTTRYRIVWHLDKTVHALKDMRVTAKLADHVKFVRATTGTAGLLDYDDKTRKVSWTLNRLPSDVSAAEMSFDIDLTPTVSDDGRFAGLLGQSDLQATDEDVKETILSTSKALTTDLQDDAGAKGKGVVRKP